MSGTLEQSHPAHPSSSQLDWVWEPEAINLLSYVKQIDTPVAVRSQNPVYSQCRMVALM